MNLSITIFLHKEKLLETFNNFNNLKTIIIKEII